MKRLSGQALDRLEDGVLNAPPPPIQGAAWSHLAAFAVFAFITPLAFTLAWLAVVLAHAAAYRAWVKHLFPRIRSRTRRAVIALAAVSLGCCAYVSLPLVAALTHGPWGIVAGEALLAFLTLAASGPNGRSRALFFARFAPVAAGLAAMPPIALWLGAPAGAAASLAMGNLLLAAMAVTVSRRRSANLEAFENAVKSADAAQRLAAGLVAAAPMAFVMTDKDLRILHASPAWRREEGLEDVEVVGRTLYEVWPGSELWKDAHDAGLRGEHRRNDRMEMTRADGLRRWARVEMAPWHEADGEVAGLLITMHDVTEMVQSYEQIERSEQRLKLAVELTDLHVWELDYARQTLETAGDDAALFDFQRTFQTMTPSILTMVHPDDRDAMVEAWQSRTKRSENGSRKFRSFEHRIDRRDGKEVWVATIAELINDEDGQPLRMIGAMQDITRRKQAETALIHAKEEAEAANRAKSAFLATMSHEIRTPLNGVLGMAQAMAAGDLARDQREKLGVIRQSGETLLAILNDVLDLSKIEAGKLELEAVDFDLGEVARGAHAAFTALASGKDVAFSLQVSDSARGLYRGDATRVRQILYNLISNALKFTDRGEVRVTASRRDDNLILEVSDTGIGIPSDRLATLFQNFVQADASTTRRFGGTGLGLSICRQLAEMMGGAVAATSIPGRGSTFVATLAIPRISDEVRAAPPSVVHAPEIPEESAASTLRVLAAEDNAVNQLVLKTLLSQIGVTPRVVDNGAEALAAWEQEPWDIILMDIQMPVMDGPSATREIRRREAETRRRRTPIVALTANAMAHQIAEYMAGGMDGFVAKPIEIGRLFDVLNEAPAAAIEEPARRIA
jgi:PAS domain S-box-containing protein